MHEVTSCDEKGFDITISEGGTFGGFQFFLLEDFSLEGDYKHSLLSAFKPGYAIRPDKVFNLDNNESFHSLVIDTLRRLAFYEGMELPLILPKDRVKGFTPRWLSDTNIRTANLAAKYYNLIHAKEDEDDL
jgi:hypothetical protein